MIPFLTVRADIIIVFGTFLQSENHLLAYTLNAFHQSLGLVAILSVHVQTVTQIGRLNRIQVLVRLSLVSNVVVQEGRLIEKHYHLNQSLKQIQT